MRLYDLALRRWKKIARKQADVTIINRFSGRLMAHSEHLIGAVAFAPWSEVNPELHTAMLDTPQNNKLLDDLDNSLKIFRANHLIE